MIIKIIVKVVDVIGRKVKAVLLRADPDSVLISGTRSNSIQIYKNESNQEFKEWAEYRNRKLSWNKDKFLPEELIKIREERKIVKQHTKERLRGLNVALNVGIFFKYATGGGQNGKVAAIINGLSDLYKKITFTIYDQGNSLLKQNEFKNTHKRSNVRVSQGVKGASKNDVEVNLYAQGASSQQGVERFNVVPHIEAHGKSFLSDKQFPDSTFIDDDLANPYSTMILNHLLNERRKNKDSSWSREDIITKREGWLKDNLSKFYVRRLGEIGREEGWQTSQSIWTFAHQSGFGLRERLRELVSSQLSNRYYDEKGNGRQIVIFTSAGSIMEEEIPFINKMGIEVIWDGKVSSIPSNIDRVPITVVVSPKPLDNDSVGTLISELTGTLRRDKEDKFWVNFPLFVTGNASWAEAISVGAPWKHDGNDAFNKKEPDINIILDRYFMISGIEKDPAVYEMFKAGHYIDLEEATRHAQRLSEIMFDFNRLDDILAAAVHHALGEARNQAMMSETRRKFLEQAVVITAGLLFLPVSVQAKESEQKVLLRSKLEALKGEVSLDKRDAIIHDIQWIILGWKKNPDITPLILDFVSLMSDEDWRRNGGVLESLDNVAQGFKGTEKGFFKMISSRRQEVDTGVISPVAIWKVYQNPIFMKVAKKRSNESNQFSLARAVTYEIERHSQPLSDKNIEGMVGFIDKIGKQYENHVFLDKKSKVILVTDGVEDHAEGLLKMQHFLKDVIGISDDQISLVKAAKGTELQDAIIASKGSKTFLWTYSHGSAQTVAIGSQGSISSDVFAKALQQRGNLDELTVLARSCFSGDSWTRVINQLNNESSLPLVLASILGTTSYEDGIKMLETAVDPNRKHVTIGRMREAEDLMTHRIMKLKGGGIAVSDSTDPVGFI
ncbi:MAG: hypothetical protein WCH62_07805, partial [Candidatus Omnitrophota bacterium]